MALSFNDVLALAKAGYDKDQIAAFARYAQAPTTQPAQAPTTQPAQAPVAQPAQAPVAQPAGNDDVLSQLGALTELVQLGFINNSAQPKQQSAEDILALIINPNE